jgi:hypothetical protein
MNENPAREEDLEMKKLMALVLAVVLLSPGAAFAGSAATNAALGLGAFAVFNQILGGVGLFGALAPAAYVPPAPVYAAPPPVVYASPPVVYAPPPVVYAPAPAVVLAPPVVVPRAVIVRPHRVHPYPVPYPVRARPAVVYRHW